MTSQIHPHRQCGLLFETQADLSQTGEELDLAGDPPSEPGSVLHQ